MVQEYPDLPMPNNMRCMSKRVCKTKYKYVYIISYNKQNIYSAELGKFSYYKLFSNAREAAIAIDKEMLKHNQEPVNILKRR